MSAMSSQAIEARKALITALPFDGESNTYVFPACPNPDCVDHGPVGESWVGNTFYCYGCGDTFN